MNFIDKEIGNYRVVAAINSGAYGNVYRANHLHLDRIVIVSNSRRVVCFPPKKRGDC
jgi:hypothetical protein